MQDTLALFFTTVDKSIEETRFERKALRECFLRADPATNICKYLKDPFVFRAETPWFPNPIQSFQGSEEIITPYGL